MDALGDFLKALCTTFERFCGFCLQVIGSEYLRFCFADIIADYLMHV